MKRLFSAFISVLCILCGCSREASVTAESFGTLSTGEEVTLWHMVNANGASMDVTDYGCRIVRICMPGRDGKMDDVVVGYGDLE
jgi:aldose 1-epimerase